MNFTSARCVRFPLILVFGIVTFLVAQPPRLLAQEKPAAQKKQSKNKQLWVVPAAKAFLASLDEDQRAKATLEFDSEKRVAWHFIPMESRKGVPMMEMNEEQKKAARALLRATLSQLGYNKATKVMQLESVLLKLEGPDRASVRNPEKYYFTVFGTPKQKTRWGLSIEGHHLSLNFVFEGGKFLDSTPQFFAANPAMLKDNYGDGFRKGLRVLKAEEQLAFDLLKSFDEEQMKTVMLPGETPDEIRAAGEAQPPLEELGGLAASEMTSEQKEILEKLLKTYTSKMKPVVAKARLAQIAEAGIDKVKFAWSGAKRLGIGHYYVIQGPKFLVEFINVQPDAAGNPANHIHCVWRDLSGDFDLPAK
ncbi:MAG: DUF3500 domain-containing protein [Pirellulaceae bacterium]